MREQALSLPHPRNWGGGLLSVGLSLLSAVTVCVPEANSCWRLPREKLAEFEQIPSSSRLASAPDLGAVLGNLSRHFLAKGVIVAERAVYANPRGRIQALLLTFSDSKRAKEYHLFWRAVEMLAGPVRDFELSGAEACTLSVASRKWAVLSGRFLLLFEPEGIEVPLGFVEGMVEALKAPPRPVSLEIKLPLREFRGRPIIALRDLASSIKAPLSYDARRGEALLGIGNFLLAFKPGRPEVMVGEASLPLPCPPLLVEGRICLTPEAVEALIGARVEMDRKGRVLRLLFPSPTTASSALPPEAESKGKGCIEPKGASEEAEGKVP